MWEGLGWLGCLMVASDPSLRAEARARVEALSVDEPLLVQGLMMADGEVRCEDPIFAKSMPLPLYQLMVKP